VQSINQSINLFVQRTGQKGPWGTDKTLKWHIFLGHVSRSLLLAFDFACSSAMFVGGSTSADLRNMKITRAMTSSF